jgi:hypothetical protein
MIVSAWKWFWGQFGFGEPVKRFPVWSATDDFETHPFFTEHQRKTERLAAIARERTALKETLAKAVKQKKARAPIYLKLRALSSEELRIESGK